MSKFSTILYKRLGFQMLGVGLLLMAIAACDSKHKPEIVRRYDNKGAGIGRLGKATQNSGMNTAGFAAFGVVELKEIARSIDLIENGEGSQSFNNECQGITTKKIDETTVTFKIMTNTNCKQDWSGDETFKVTYTTIADKKRIQKIERQKDADPITIVIGSGNTAQTISVEHDEVELTRIGTTNNFNLSANSTFSLDTATVKVAVEGQIDFESSATAKLATQTFTVNYTRKNLSSNITLVPSTNGDAFPLTCGVPSGEYNVTQEYVYTTPAAKYNPHLVIRNNSASVPGVAGNIAFGPCSKGFTSLTNLLPTAEKFVNQGNFRD